MLQGTDLTKVLALERTVADLQRRLASLSGAGVSTAHGALIVRTTQLGFRGEITGHWDGGAPNTGYPWERHRLEGVGFETPDAPLTGDRAVAVDGDTTLPAGTVGWFEPSPEANGYIFQPAATATTADPDCLDSLLMAGADTCFHATTVAGTGPCSTFDDTQELDFAWDVSDEVYYSSTALTTPDGTVKNLKLWLDVTGEPRPALAFADDTFRFAYAGCVGGAMVFKARKELCDDPSDTGSTTSPCGDQPFEVHVVCTACPDVPIPGCDELCGDGIPVTFWLCLTTADPDDPFGGQADNGLPRRAEVRYAATAPNSWGPGVGQWQTVGDGTTGIAVISDAFVTIGGTPYPNWSLQFLAGCRGNGKIWVQINVSVNLPGATGAFVIFPWALFELDESTPLGTLLWSDANSSLAGAPTMVELTQQLSCADFTFGLRVSESSLGGDLDIAVSASEPTDCGDTPDEPDCSFGDDPLVVTISSGANAGTYTTSSATTGVRTVTIGGTDYSIQYDTGLGKWTAFPTVAGTPVIAATAQGPCPILEVTFPGELFGSDDPVVTGPPIGGTGCTMLDSDQEILLSGGLLGAPFVMFWTAATQRASGVGGSGEGGTTWTMFFRAVGGVFYALWYTGIVSDPTAADPDYTVAADASPVCDDPDCYTATFSDPTLLLLTDATGPITLKIGSCPTACARYAGAGPYATNQTPTFTACGNWSVSATFTTSGGSMRVEVILPGTDNKVIGDLVHGGDYPTGQARLYAFVGGSFTIAGTWFVPAPIAEGSPHTLTVSRTGAGTFTFEVGGGTTASLGVSASFADESVASASIAGQGDDAGETAWSVADICAEGDAC